MAGVKRPYDTTSGEVQSLSRKVPRLKESLNSALSISSPAPSIPKRPSLDTLPTEVLRQILFNSYEPNLIHACRSLYQRLPDYEAYVKSLAILAFTPRKCPWTRTYIPPVNVPLPGLKYSLDPEQLQIEVCRSPWLTPAILRVIHLTLLENLVHATILLPEVAQDPRDRELFEKRLQSLKHDYRAEHSIWLGLFARQCNVSPLDDRDISIDGFWISVYVEADAAVHGENVSIREWSSVLEVSTIPDCLLVNPTDPTAYAFIDHMIYSYEPSDLCDRARWHLTCSHELMQKALLSMLRDPELHQDDVSTQPSKKQTFFRLLELNSSCTPPAPLTAHMLTLASNKNEPGILKHFLKHLPRGPGCVSIEDLLRLELSLQRHQHKCYKLLYRELEEERRGEAIGQDMLQRLGYPDAPRLWAARCVVNAMFYPDL